MITRKALVRPGIGFLACLMMLVIPQIGLGQIHRLADITKTEFEALDRDRTAVLFPLGVIEEHGPYLPLLTDSYVAEWLVDEIAGAIIKQKGWSALIMPSLPIGVGAPEDFGPRKRTFGSIPLRPSTKRAILMDLVSGLGVAGFQWIFAVDIHGPRVNQRITDEASQYFEDVYGGTMVNLTGVAHPDPPAASRLLSAEEREEDGLAIHAGLLETSWVKYIRPDLVRPEHSNAPPITAKSWDDYKTIPNEEDWPGYVGTPRLARTDIGADRMNVQAINAADLALRIIAGLDHTPLRRSADGDDPGLKRLDKLIADRSARIEKQQQQWLEENGIQ